MASEVAEKALVDIPVKSGRRRSEVEPARPDGAGGRRQHFVNDELEGPN